MPLCGSTTLPSFILGGDAAADGAEQLFVRSWSSARDSLELLAAACNAVQFSWVIGAER